MKRSALILGVAGGVIAIASSISALLTVGGNPQYQSRLWAGCLTLALSVLAGSAAIFIARRPVAASIVMSLSGLVGFFSINLYYINTWYILALPIWLVALILAVSSQISIRSKNNER
jgi:energy-coupling factor transporter transmembrane protein EcfT